MTDFIFDLYNTLIDIRTDEHCEAAWTPVIDYFRLDVPWQTLMQKYDEGWQVEFAELAKQKRYAYPEGDLVRVFAHISDALGFGWSDALCAEAASCMRRASMVRFKLFDGTLELITKLRALGSRLYLLSNAQACITYDEIELSGLAGRFDGMLISSECGCRKPDPKYFGMLFDKYGLKKSDAVMIGDDKESDGKGAKAFGIKFIHCPDGAASLADKLIKLVGGK